MQPRIRQHQKSDLETAEQQQVRLSFVRERSKKFGMILEGVPYYEELAGRAGMRFLLLPEAHHVLEDVQRAAAVLWRQRDVVSMEVFWPSHSEMECSPC